MNAQTASTWLALLIVVLGFGARCQSLEEAKVNHEKWITDLSLADKQLDARLDSLERDRQTIERLHQLELRLTALEEQGKRKK